MGGNNNDATIAPYSSPYRLAFSLSVIYGSFTLGFYVAIQGPTLMDLIDLLHVNNDIMSYSLAFASLAYSLGGLLSGFLFNYVDRQVLIPGYYIVFGIANTITPYINNYYIFSAITVFKMMCAGGTDCGANVWILDLWPGKDAWLQALHFSFAVGCALGPLVVEPFLSAGDHTNNTELEAKLNNNNGHTLINDQSTESRIYIPYGVSGAASLLAASVLIYLHYKEEKWRKQQQSRLRSASISNQKQLNASGEQILMNSVHHPAAIEAGLAPPSAAGSLATPRPHSASQTTPAKQIPPSQQQTAQQVASMAIAQAPSAAMVPLLGPQQVPPSQHPNQQQNSATPQHLALQIIEPQQKAPSASALTNIKFTSKAKEQPAGRPPYYVMFAIALCALCLSFYCGIEITSMNYLATFAVNIDLQLPKSTAALMSSALTISFAIGRLIGIWIAAYMKPHKLFYLCSCVMATGNLCILLFANNNETLLWYSICLFGVGCGPMFASIVSFYDDRISKVTNTVSGIFILGSMFNVALNSLIIGHYIIDNALILIVCNLIGSVLLLFLFGSLHTLTRVKRNQRKRKFRLMLEQEHRGDATGGGQQQQTVAIAGGPGATTRAAAPQTDPDSGPMSEEEEEDSGGGEAAGQEKEGGEKKNTSSREEDSSPSGRNSRWEDEEMKSVEELDASSDASMKKPRKSVIIENSVEHTRDGSNTPEEHDKLLADNSPAATTTTPPSAATATNTASPNPEQTVNA